MGGLLGWINIFLILTMAMIYPIKMQYQRTRNKDLLAVYKRVKIAHPFVGGAIIIIAFVHGYLQLGTLRMHSGLYVLITIALMGIIALIGPRIKVLRKRWRSIHRLLFLPLIILILLHVL
ncbi:hypothetical protein [Alkaliphilus peptidifermentans]|uniref:Ferric reductase like transmembrane component n=1 Tax=Alkaliphilus peptidifermentans DSM 18978 TaxID=1120976 RepID=A0A1G5F2A8_9FIRM|nr:hypothetical protein [Alkaliphilus peptidifermentans]SCY33337.1 hypothetical protein SAMN03080606_01314 [Alkaliphilus peptidifermentans DSM 18978]